MSFKSLRQISLLSALACATGSATAGVELRVESMPIVQPIDAYILVTDGESPVAGLTAEDFSITLDGNALEEFEFSLPPSQDPSQNVSVVIVAPASQSGTTSDYPALIDELDVGDHVSIVKYFYYRSVDFLNGRLAILPFTRIDGGMGSNAIAEFLGSGWPPEFTLSSLRPVFFHQALLAGLREFDRPSVGLPDGPRGIVTASTSTGFPSLSTVIAAANANGIPIFNAGWATQNSYPDADARSTALAIKTGGVRVPIAEGESSADALAKMASWLENGYHITIPQDAVTDCNPHILEVSAGGESISVSFVRCDTTPELFDFADLTNVAVGTTVVSEPAVITGIETATPVTVMDGEYSIGCGSSFTSEPGWIMPGESVCLRHTSAPQGGLEVYTLFIAGGESAWFASSTIFQAPPPPAPPAPAVVSRNAGGGGSAGVAELLLLVGLLLARQRGGRDAVPDRP